MFESNTGAKRSERKPRYDLISKVFIERVAQRLTGEIIKINLSDLQDGGDLGREEYTGGALKYGECNWEKGLPTSDIINHIYDHLASYADYFRQQLKFNGGNMNDVVNSMQSFSKNEDHLAGIACGLIFLMHQENQGKMFHDDLFKPPTSTFEPEEKDCEKLLEENIELRELVIELTQKLDKKKGKK